MKKTIKGNTYSKWNDSRLYFSDNPDFTDEEKSIMEKRVGYVCRKVIDRIDKDGDGTVSVREAVNAMRGSWKDW